MHRILSAFSLLIVFTMFFTACVTGEEFSDSLTCISQDIIPVDINEFVNSLEDTPSFVEDDIVIALYVTSTDQFDNVYGAIYLQDDPLNPKTGFELRTDLMDYYLLYPPGSMVYLKLQGLYVQPVKGGVRVGSRLESFGNFSIGRLPSAVTKRHLNNSCQPAVVIQPKALDPETLGGQWQYLFVSFPEMQLASEDLCKSYSAEKETALRNLMTCGGAVIQLENSGYSEFYDEIMPSGMGVSSGILKYNGSKPRLLLNHPDDLALFGDRCNGVVYNCDSPPQAPEDEAFEVLISEIADPVNNTTNLNLRFIELYNPGDGIAELSGWELRRYTNANESYTQGSVITFNGIIIAPRATLVIAASTEHFEQGYGFLPDMEGGAGSAADSNGDDNLVLVDSHERVRDVFGTPGEDGTNTAHDFQDGRAVRLFEVKAGNHVFTASEWQVYNGHGEQGTIARVQEAPGDYTPGVHQ